MYDHVPIGHTTHLSPRLVCLSYMKEALETHVGRNPPHSSLLDLLAFLLEGTEWSIGPTVVVGPPPISPLVLPVFLA